MQFDIMCYFIQSFTLCTDHFANSCNLKIWPGRNYSLRHSYHLLEYILPVEVETVRQAKRVFIWLWKAASASISLYRYDSFTSDKITNFWLNSNQFFMFTHKVTSVTFRWKSTILTFCRNDWYHWTVLNSYIHFFFSILIHLIDYIVFLILQALFQDVEPGYYACFLGQASIATI